MIIYLEGPDGSGKSTLSDAITRELIEKDKVVYQVKDGNCAINTHPKSPERNTLNELVLAITSMAYDDTNIYVLDRGPISDVIYREFDDYLPVINKAPLVSLLDSMIQNNKLLMIFCLTDVAEQKMLERGDDNPIAIKKHKQITKRYKEWDNLYDYAVFDYTDSEINEFIENIITPWIEEEVNE